MSFLGTFGSTEKEALQLLTPVVNQALYAHEIGDYDKFLSVITDELAKNISEEGFARGHQEIAPKLGKLISKSFVGSFRRGGNPMFVFSAKYAKTDDDILINVTFRNGTEPPLIDWLWIE